MNCDTEDLIPNSWIKCTFGDIATIKNGFAFKSSSFKKSQELETDVPLIRQSQLKKSTVDLTDAVYLDHEQLVQNPNYIIRQGDILIGMSGSIGRVCIYKNDRPALQNQRTGKIAPFAPDMMKERFFGLFLSNIEHNLTKHARGVGVQNISAKDIESLIFFLPPANEQTRIVEKIEELFSELDKGVESLKTVQQQLKVYRQALLKQAFEGKLTEQWRKDNPDKVESAEQLLKRIKAEREARYQQQFDDWKQAVKEWEDEGKEGKKPVKPKQQKEIEQLSTNDGSNLPELPEGWDWCNLGSISDVTGGLTKNSKRQSFALQVPYLRVANVYANRLELNEVLNIGVTEAELSRVKLQKGDLLIVEGNGSIEQIGRVALWSGEVSGCAHQNHLIKARPLPSLDSAYAMYFLLSKQGRDLIVEVASSTSGLHTLSISKVENLRIPLSSPAEQSEIAKILDEKLSLLDQMEDEIKINLKRTEALRQSILKKAFSGQLVAQDPNDEPASELLKRIRTEREAAELAEKEAKAKAKKAEPKRKPRTTKPTAA